MKSEVVPIWGGYSETFGFGLSDNFHWGRGGILKLSDLDSLTIFIFGGGGYSETLGFGLSDNFHFQGGGGYSETFGFGLSDNFHFQEGGILKLSDLDSDNFHFLGEGYSETLRFGLSDNFHFRGGRGGYSETVLQNRGYSGRIWTKISTTPAGSCITDSLSHTTYVETNKRKYDEIKFTRNF